MASVVESEDTLATNEKKYEEFLDALDEDASELETNPYDENIEKLDEQELYTPRFFIREITVDEETGKKKYHYRPNGNKYWEQREKGDWSDVPRIFDDDCEPFF